MIEKLYSIHLSTTCWCQDGKDMTNKFKVILQWPHQQDQLQGFMSIEGVGDSLGGGGAHYSPLVDVSGKVHLH